MKTTTKAPEPYWNPTRKTVTKDELLAFADRLHRRMLELGLTQADLARNAFGLDKQGRVIDRDKVSLYLRAKGLPGKEKMTDLARALKMPMHELAPRITQSPHAAMEVKAVEPLSSVATGVRIESLPGKQQDFVAFVMNARLRQEDAAELYALATKLIRNAR